MSRAARRRMLAAGLLAGLLAAGCSVGDVRLEDGSERSRDIGLQVGNVDIGRDCRLDGRIEIEAGNVDIGARSVITGEIRVNHGNVALEEGVQANSVRVANGAVSLGAGAQIFAGVTLTNGLLEVRGAEVSGPVSLKRGRLEVLDGSRLNGGLQVNNSGRGLRDSTVVIIKAGAVVSGRVDIEGLVRLVVQPGADIQSATFSAIGPARRE